MPTNGSLTQQDLDQLDTKGYIKVRAFPKADAAEIESLIWHKLAKDGVLHDDPSTWHIYPGGLSRSVRNSYLFRQPLTPEFKAVIDQLVGPDRWTPPRDLGALLYTFPEDRPWDIADGWHWHGDPRRNIGGRRDIFLFTFLTRVEPQGGGTVLIENSHRVVCDFYQNLSEEEQQTKVKFLKRKFFATHPWLKGVANIKDAENRRQRFMDAPTDVLGHPLRVVELTGEPGEVYITHMSTLHARSFNISDRPRFMTAKGITQKDPEPVAA